MTQEFVNYNQALALKELGFDEACFAKYTSNRLLLSINWSNVWCENINESEIYAPLKQQVFKWFRDKYDLWFRPDYYDEMREYNYQGSIHQLGRYSSLASLDNCKTVEELEAKCIDKLIEIVKNK